MLGIIVLGPNTHCLEVSDPSDMNYGLWVKSGPTARKTQEVDELAHFGLYVFGRSFTRRLL